MQAPVACLAQPWGAGELWRLAACCCCYMLSVCCAHLAAASMLDAPLPTQTSQDCCISKQRLALVHSVVNEAQMG